VVEVVVVVAPAVLGAFLAFLPHFLSYFLSFLAHLLTFLSHLRLHFCHGVCHLMQQLHLSGGNWICSSRWRVRWRIHLWLWLVNNPPATVVSRQIDTTSLPSIDHLG
jgi:hypothetical protein